MGNCAGYCVGEGGLEGEQKKVTVEGAFANPNYQSITTLTQNADGAQEFEIEYGSKLQDGQDHQKFPRGATQLATGKTEGEASGPITLPNGSVYTGQRQNNKKHGRGQ